MSKKFKEYSQNQLLLIPPSLDELVPENHVARVIDSYVNDLDVSVLYSAFPGGGRPSYDPIMMLKVLIYAYCNKTFSSREIEKNLIQNVVYMWLSGMQQPDHNTINRFRSTYLNVVLDEVFFQVVWMLKEKGFINLNELFVDGTKMEANAGRNTYTWRKNVERYKEGVKEKIVLLLEEINNINKREDEKYGDAPDPALTIGKEIDENELKKAALEANESLKKKSDRHQSRKS